MMSPHGHIIIEVPSLDDPLRSLYRLPEYEAFFFQAQHPYYYSGESLKRLLEIFGFRDIQIIPHQRYSLENHLNWLMQRKPGGNETFRTLFTQSQEVYRKELESSGKTDTVIAVASL
jgi:hypothetical protein